MCCGKTDGAGGGGARTGGMRMIRPRDALRCSLLLMLPWGAPMAAPTNVTTGPAMDYQPAVLRSSDDGARIAVFERLDPATYSGDLWLTRLEVGAEEWTTPLPIIATAANERHPALVQRGPRDYALFYLEGTGAASSFRIWRAASSDGLAFIEEGQLDLGWSTGGEVNPHVIRHADGTLTMSYQRLGAGSYIARSSDGGVSWDTLRTQIAAGSQLPRIAFRERDGLYLASYQVGSSALSMYVKSTHDPHDWSAPARDFAVSGNNHDSLPVVMPGGALALFWIRQQGSGFDIALRRSIDGVVWEAPIEVTSSPGADDVEPHPLVGSSAVAVEFYWGRAVVGGSNDYDIVREQRVMVVADAIFDSGFEDS